MKTFTFTVGLNTFEVVGLSASLRMSKAKKAVKILCQRAGLPVIKLQFIRFNQEGINAVFSPGGIWGVLAGLGGEPCIVVDLRFLEKEHFSKIGRVLVHEVRHYWQHKTMPADYSSHVVSHGLLDSDLSIDEITWRSWAEVDARAWAAWWFDGRRRGEAYTMPQRDEQLVAQAERYDDLADRIEARYQRFPKLEMEWFGEVPVFEVA